MDTPNEFAASRRDVLKIGSLAALGGIAASAVATTGAGAASLRPAVLPGSSPVSVRSFQVLVDGVVVKVATVDIATDSGSTLDPASPSDNTITLTRNFASTSEWYKWRKAVLDGKVDRRSMSVIFHNDAGQEVGRMNFFNCWPSKWQGPSLNARSSGHASEKIEISWETMELKAG